MCYCLSSSLTGYGCPVESGFGDCLEPFSEPTEDKKVLLDTNCPIFPSYLAPEGVPCSGCGNNAYNGAESGCHMCVVEGDRYED